MIQSAMMFALGFFVSGLAWLALSVALVRRARRLTERRLLASISTRRAEFETERDELRARHAVQMYRLEREVSRVLDMATAHRLEADVKEHDLVSLKAELTAREDDLQEMQARLAAERETTQSLERRHAEAGSALRSVQHALQLEIKRRMAAEEALDAVGGGATERIRHANGGAATAANVDEIVHEYDSVKLPRVAPESQIETTDAPSGGSVVAMPTRMRAMPVESAENSNATAAAAPVALLAGEAHADLGTAIWRAPATSSGAMPPAVTPDAVAPAPGEASVAELVARRIAPASDTPPSTLAGDGENGENSEARFFEALAEIRALRRAARQAGE